MHIHICLYVHQDTHKHTRTHVNDALSGIVYRRVFLVGFLSLTTTPNWKIATCSSCTHICLLAVHKKSDHNAISAIASLGESVHV